MTSTVPGLPAGLWSYDADDRFTAGDTYDNDGNTVGSGGIANVYDFENRLVQQAGLSIVYDGDGNRVSKTTANGTTQYLVDEQNPTGYAQVMDEVQASAVVRTYTWGLELVSELFPVGSPLSTNHSPLFYVFDGHGSVRALTNASGAVTDTYDYDAFGNLIHSTGTTPNNYLFAGEQFDPDLNLYYNRARYLNTGTGRFWSMDTDEGDDDDPGSLHKYLYAEGDAVDNLDPSGNQIDAIGALGISETLDSLPQLNFQTILGFVNGSIEKVPLSGGAYHKWMKLISEAEQDVFNSDCACFLSAHGLDSLSEAEAMLFQIPYDGTKSKITKLNAGLYPNAISEEQAEGYSELSIPVRQDFEQHQNINAETQAHGATRTDVYFRPGAFDKITIEHEALHSLTGKSDSDLANQLGWNGSGSPSVFISQALRDNRCDKRKARKKKK
jgi:RHS repeat-associated protein